MDATKKSIIYFAVGLLLFGAGYWMGSRAVIHSDGDAADTVGDHISAAQDAAAGAGAANRDAQDTADRLGNSNQTIADLIEQGESILAGIRSGGEENT